MNGAFGVPKNKAVPGTEHWEEPLQVLRLIINLHPPNQLQCQIEGDVSLLPYFGQWLGVELLEHGVVLWSGDDLRCSVYVWELPRPWQTFFCT